MGKSCCAVGCVNRYKKNSGIHFYRFQGRRARWIAAVGHKDWVPTQHSWICSTHFLSGAKSNDPLLPDYVPSIFSYTKSPLKRKLAKDRERYERAANTKKRRVEAGERLCAAQSLLDLSNMGNGTEYCEPHTGLHTMTTLSMADIKQLEEDKQKLVCDNLELKEKYEQLLKDNRKLVLEHEALKLEHEKLVKEYEEKQEKIHSLTNALDQRSLTRKSFEGNGTKVQYFTGIHHFVMLIAVFNFIVSCVETNSNTLPHFQQFLMTLMKLRLNSGDQDLAYRFGVCQSTVSRYLKKWIDAM